MNDKVVEASGIAGSSGIQGVSAREIEQAMADAVSKAMEAGIIDPDEIRRLQLEARKKLVEQTKNEPT